MKKIFILLASMFLLSGCIESLVTIGGGAANGKLSQSSLQSAASYGVKKTTGKTPIGHAINLVKKENSKKNKSCSTFDNKKDLELCLMLEKRISSKQAKVEEKKYLNKTSKELTSSLQFSINEKSKIKYLDK
jgi:hypothetical protein|tara:strand:+ start:331 stop:726 length:396 start_codon:yes stop_codon:yes gene_type:complete